MSDKLPPKILVLETDELARTSIGNYIERYWFTVLRVGDADSAMRLLTLEHPHIMLIGPSFSGPTLVDLCLAVRKIHTMHDMPLIVILDQDDPIENYKVLDNGLTEYIRKPYTTNEIMTAIKALIRRSKPVFQDKVIRYKDISMDLATYKVYRGDKNIHLGHIEFKVLQLLVQSPKVIFSRQQIIDYVWGPGMNIANRTVDVHVNRIRALLQKHKHELPLIKTVRNAGYCLNLPGEVD